jgi:hypothetical protein
MSQHTSRSDEEVGLFPTKKRRRSRRSNRIPPPSEVCYNYTLRTIISREFQGLGSDMSESVRELRKTIECLQKRVKCLEETSIRDSVEWTRITHRLGVEQSSNDVENSEVDLELMYQKSLIDSLYGEVEELRVGMENQSTRIDQLIEHRVQEETAKQQCIQVMADCIEMLKSD